MMSDRISFALRVLSAAAVAFPLLGTIGATTTTPSPAPAPDLSVSLTSDAGALAAGDDVTYTAEIVNHGDVVDARIVVAPPPFIELTNAADGGTVADDLATWSATLPAGATTTVTASATVSDIPGDEQRATALVSVYVNGAETPLIRSASADRIAGVEEAKSKAPDAQTMPVWAIAGIGVAVALAAVAVSVMLVRRRRTDAAG